MERRLSAILAADVVGYSRLMGLDEAGTLSVLKAIRTELIDPKIVEHKGRVFKTTGDGVLIDFASVVNAVACAVDIQRGMATRNTDLSENQAIHLRIGVNLGDVILEGDDIFGDGVNVAARLQGIAVPGGIAVSGTARDHIGNRLSLQYEDMGEQAFKNIAQPVRVYQVRVGSETTLQRAGPTLPDKPSIAVLPFQNMSGDPEQEYFADGMVEEIITALSRMRWLFVIARNSSFTYKGRAVDIKQVGRELGVRYVLEGSVRKAGNKVRITGQLIDASSGAHLWADRFEGGLEDIFDMQDRVTSSVVGALSPRLEQAEIDRAKRKPTESLDAYDYFLRGLACVHLWEREANTEALSHFYRAIELDPNFALAYGMAARCYSQRKASGWDSDRLRETAETGRLARRAAELGRDDALALCTAGLGLAFVADDAEEGAALIDRALALNPNLAWAWTFSGWTRVWLGEHEIAIDHAARAMRLSPNDPQVFNMQAVTACAHFFAGRYTEAVSWAEKASRAKNNHLLATCIAAAAHARAGHQEEAEKSMLRLRQLDPALRINNLRDRCPLRRADDLANCVGALRIAGLEEE